MPASLPYDEYEIVLHVRVGRRVAERARKYEAEEIGKRILDHLRDHEDASLGGEGLIRVRRLTPS